MRGTVDAKDLKAAARFVSPAVPQLMRQAVTLMVQDDGLAVVASDGGMVRMSVVDADFEAGGAVVVPFPLLSGVASRATGRLRLEATEGRLVVSSGRTRFEVPLLPDDYRAHVAPPETWGHHVDRDEWAAVLKQVVPFVARDQTRPALMQVLVQGGTVYGSDSYRLGFRPTGLPDMHLPVEVLHGDEVDIQVDGNLVFVRSGNNVVGSPVAAEQSPNYRQIIPETFDVEVEVDSDELGALVDEGLALANNKSVIELTFEGEVLRTRVSEPDGGVAEGSMGTSGIGEPLTIGFRAVFLSEALKVFEGPVNVGLISPLRPAMFMQGEVQHLLMPVRLNK